MLNINLGGLSPEQIAKRVNSIGGSDANTIMSGNSEWIEELWLEKRGEREHKNLDGKLPVVMGQFTEPLNAYWYGKQTGREVLEMGREVTHGEHTWRTATLDGVLRENDDPMGITDAVWEAKHVNAWSKEDEVLATYMPQLHHNMDCLGADRAVLSVFIGTQKHVVLNVEYDPIYAIDLLRAEQAFWDCVKTGERPVAIEVEAPMPDKLRQVDMTGNNKWADAAADFIEYQAASKKFNASKKVMKGLISKDVGLAEGHGVTAKRAKNGAISIGETK